MAALWISNECKDQVFVGAPVEIDLKESPSLPMDIVVRLTEEWAGRPVGTCLNVGPWELDYEGET